MKHNILILLLLLSGHCLGYAQQVASGTVTDGRHPIAGANVFIKDRRLSHRLTRLVLFHNAESRQRPSDGSL